MPQLDFSTYLSQIFWLAITFGALYLIVARMALPAIGGAIEHRRSRIADDLDAAERFKRDAEKALADYESSLAESRARAQKLVQEQKEKVTAELEAARTRTEAELAAKIAEAEAKVRASKEEALKELSGAIGGLTGEIVTRLTGEKPSPEQLKKAVEKVLG